MSTGPDNTIPTTPPDTSERSEAHRFGGVGPADYDPITNKVQRKYGPKPLHRRAPKKPIPPEVTEKRRAAMNRAREALNMRKAQRAIVEKKIKQGLPVTPEEMLFLKSKNSLAKSPQQREEEDRLTIAKAAKIVINPKSITELRALIEHTAAKHKYNPIEELIIMAMDPNSSMKESDRIAVHKTLLPYLAPVMPTPKDTSKSEGGVKVTIHRFEFTSDAKQAGSELHTEAPKMVTLEPEEPEGAG